MTIAHKIIAACALAGFLVAASAQTAVLAPPQNVLQLSTTGIVETQQDLLVMTLGTTRDGADAAAVQGQLKTVLEAALAEARKQAVAGQLDVRTGNFSLYPRYTRDGKINGWTGSVELVLEGRDFPRISQVAGRVPGLTMNGVAFSLSREQRAKVEGDAQQQAIERFKAKAAELARSFGFTGYTLREVAVNANDASPMPMRMRTMAMEAKASSDSAVPVEAGKAQVVVTVSGSVQLR